MSLLIAHVFRAGIKRKKKRNAVCMQGSGGTHLHTQHREAEAGGSQ